MIASGLTSGCLHLESSQRIVATLARGAVVQSRWACWAKAACQQSKDLLGEPEPWPSLSCSRGGQVSGIAGPGEAVSNAQRERWLVQHAWALVSPSHAASMPQVLVTGGVAQGRMSHLINWNNASPERGSTNSESWWV